MTHKPIFPRQPDPFDTAMRDLESQLEASRAEVKRLQWLVEAEGVRVKSAEAEVQRLHGLADELARVEAARAALEELVQVILTSVREDEKGQQWAIRAFLDKRDVCHENLSGSRRLVAEACKSVLDAKAEAR